VVYAQAGDDRVEVAGGIDVPAMLVGGMGNDKLKGGGCDDVLIGGDGDDQLIGGDGRDLLIGGIGRDDLVGNSDDDMLVAGYTSFDNNEAALDKIMSEWSSGRSYQTRVDNLAGEGTGTRDNDSFFLNAVTVFDDADRDVLTGSAGTDWFLFNADGDGSNQDGDRATDVRSSEVVDDIDIWV
jgi:Ca2+-binding RTX toxin-like protein